MLDSDDEDSNDNSDNDNNNDNINEDKNEEDIVDEDDDLPEDLEISADDSDTELQPQTSFRTYFKKLRMRDAELFWFPTQN